MSYCKSKSGRPRPLLATESLTDSLSDSDTEKNVEIKHSHSSTNQSLDLANFLNGPLSSDRFYLVYGIFYVLGMVTLVPWNFFITADQYWLFKFHDLTLNTDMEEIKDRTFLQKSFTTYFNIASSIPFTICLMFTTVLNQRFSFNLRIFGSLITMTIIFILTTILINVNTDLWQWKFFLVTLISIFFVNIASAVLSGSVYGIAGKFSPSYITALVSGQSLGGIFAATIQILAITFKTSPIIGAIVYFVIGDLLLLIAIALSCLLIKSEFFQHNLMKRTKNCGCQVDVSLLMVHKPHLDQTVIFRKIFAFGFVAMLNAIVTFSIYPGTTVLVRPLHEPFDSLENRIYFIPVTCYLLFNIGDFCGRNIAGLLQWPKNNERIKLIMFSLLRLGFVPLIFLCNVQPRLFNWPVLIQSDFIYGLIMFLFALSNGYITNITTILAPKNIFEEEKELGSSMIAIFVGIGLAIGCILSFILLNIS